MKLTKSQRKVIDAKAEVKRLWVAMCEHEGINPVAPFVVFSPENPLQTEYNHAMIELQAALKAEKRNQARRDRHAVLVDMGLKRVRGALGGIYYE